VTTAALAGVALSRLVVQYLSSEIFDSIGIYLPMMAVNWVTGSGNWICSRLSRSMVI